MKTIIRKRLDGRQSTPFTCEGESRTKQSFKQECDVNNLLKRYNKTGQLPQYIKENPTYGDFSDVTDYQEALNTVSKAMLQFEMLPSHVRARFSNSPENFLEFANRPENRKEMVNLGLATETRVETIPGSPNLDQKRKSVKQTAPSDPDKATK